jgi:hypothetical protein
VSVNVKCLGFMLPYPLCLSQGLFKRALIFTRRQLWANYDTSGPANREKGLLLIGRHSPV